MYLSPFKVNDTDPQTTQQINTLHVFFQDEESSRNQIINTTRRGLVDCLPSAPETGSNICSILLSP